MSGRTERTLADERRGMLALISHAVRVQMVLPSCPWLGLLLRARASPLPGAPSSLWPPSSPPDATPIF